MSTLASRNPGAWLADAAACRALDAEVIEGHGVPGVALMEVASRGVALALLERFAPQARSGVLVVAGSGNNGGDGWGAARWLHGRGAPVRVWSLGEPGGDAAIMRSAALRAGVVEVDRPDGALGVVVDAVFGTGLAREVTGAYARALQFMRDAPCPVVAVDLPSGLHADTGVHLGPVPSADLTVTFGRLKPAFFTPGGRAAGEVVLVDIGVNPSRHGCARVADAVELASCLPHRDAGTHKHREGRLLVVAGSVEMAGAAVLVCKAALRVGCGLVTLSARPEMLPRLAGIPDAVMVRVEPAETALSDALRWDGAVAVGPGLGGGRPLGPAMVDGIRALGAQGRAVVLDADGLVDGPVGPGVVRTPHPGEARRLLGGQDVQSDRFGAVRRLASLGGVALLKGPDTLVAQGSDVSVNPTGSPTLATAGSGDVLTGVIGALLARGLSPWDAARVGAWVHGRAGERLEARRPDGWTATDIVHALPDAVGDLRASAG